MSLHVAMSREPFAKIPGYRAMRAALWAIVVVQVCAWLLVAVGYAAILGDSADSSHFLRQAHKFPMSATLTGALLTIGVFASAASAVGMLKRIKWAPFPFIIWISVTATENTFHSVYLFQFPTLVFWLSIALFYLWAAKLELRAAETSPVSSSGHQKQMWWLMSVAWLGLLAPIGAAISPFMFFAGVFSGDAVGLIVSAASLLGFARNVVYFTHLINKAFGLGWDL